MHVQRVKIRAVQQKMHPETSPHLMQLAVEACQQTTSTVSGAHPLQYTPVIVACTQRCEECDYTMLFPHSVQGKPA